MTRVLVDTVITNQNIVDIDIFDSLVGDGTKELVIQFTGTANGTISSFGWVENTSRIRDVAP